MKIMLCVLSILLVMSMPILSDDFPSPEGWNPASETTVKNPDNLWEFNNGAAEQFLAYGFQLLQYRDLAMKDLGVTVEIYDMGTRLNAFGMYTTERPEKRDPLKIGAEAVILLPYQCLLLKDRYYVKVNVYEGKLTEAAGKPLLAAIAKALEGAEDMPEELGLLPAEGMIPGSHKFVREGYLGLGDLKNCVSARYKDSQSKEFQYFILIPHGDQTPGEVWEKLAEKWTLLKPDGFPILSRDIPYKGKVGVIRVDQGLLGVTGAGSEAGLLKRFEKVR